MKTIIIAILSSAVLNSFSQERGPKTVYNQEKEVATFVGSEINMLFHYQNSPHFTGNIPILPTILGLKFKDFTYVAGVAGTSFGVKNLENDTIGMFGGYLGFQVGAVGEVGSGLSIVPFYEIKSNLIGVSSLSYNNYRDYISHTLGTKLLIDLPKGAGITIRLGYQYAPYLNMLGQKAVSSPEFGIGWTFNM